MSTIKKIWVIKYIDELGNLYREVEIDSYIEKNRLIREWANSNRYHKLTYDDVFVFTKPTGEELWYYELHS